MLLYRLFNFLLWVWALNRILSSNVQKFVFKQIMLFWEFRASRKLKLRTRAVLLNSKKQAFSLHTRSLAQFRHNIKRHIAGRFLQLQAIEIRAVIQISVFLLSLLIRRVAVLAAWNFTEFHARPAHAHSPLLERQVQFKGLPQELALVLVWENVGHAAFFYEGAAHLFSFASHKLYFF